MRRATYLTTDYKGVTIKGVCLIVDSHILYVKMEYPYKTYNTIEIENPRLTETEEGVEELFKLAVYVLMRLYRTIEIIKDNRPIFERLLVNFEDMLNMQSVKFKKKVFYSDTEREYYERNFDEVVKESYYQLFDKYIQSEDEEVTGLRNSLSPPLLRRIIHKVLSETKN